MRGVASLVVLLCALVAPVAAFASDFEHPASTETSQQFDPLSNPQREDTPDDPDYDVAETGGSTNIYDERFDLFGFPSKFTPTALYKDGPNALKPMVAGFNAAGAWKIQRGRRDVSVAILDTGINWGDAGLRTQVALNAAELPDATDVNANGRIDVDDFATAENPEPTAQDVIRAEEDGVDDDGNGYVDDIAGWDFFDDDNDPADTSSYFAADGHGTGRAKEVAERGNDGHGSIGVCPHCQIVPLRVWDTFVSDQTTFGLAILYATDRGAKVIEGADGGLYHSAFTERASEYAYQHGVAQVFSGDDLNTGNHNYPANYSHTMLIQGTVADTYGLGTDFGPEAAAFLGGLPIPIGSNVPTQTLFRGAGTTQYGGHSSVSMIGATGSENTGKAAGAAALVYSAGLDRTGAGGAVSLTADEVRIILEQTAEDVTALNGQGAGSPDYAADGWDPHFGWGRVNLGAAVQTAQKGTIPPEAAIWSPDWFAPLTGGGVSVTGRARARHADGFHWKLEWGAGETPAAWTTAHEGDSTGDEVLDFGTLDLEAIRTAVDAYTPPLDTGAPAFSPSGPNPFEREFSVRLVVTADGATGVDRRVFTALDDGTVRPGFPRRMGAGGEAPLRWADLDGDNVQDLVLPLEDGTVHAYDGGDAANELPGFPVETDLMKQATGHGGADGLAEVGAAAPPREPPRAVTIADLDDDGAPELITTAGRHVYVWETDGTRRAGFPVGVDTDFCRPEDQERERRHHKCGFLASPAVAHLEDADGVGGGLSIVAPALDGHVYAFRPDGSAVPNFPVELIDPDVAPADQMEAESINAPAIGDLDEDGFDDVVVASNESYPGENTATTDLLSEVLAQAGGTSRLYAISGRTGAFLDGWPAKLPGAIQSTLPLIGPGHDATIMTLPSGDLRVVATTTGSASIRLLGPDASDQGSMQLGTFGAGTDATADHTVAINLFESAIVGDVLGTGTPAVVKYGITVGQAVNLLLVGQNQPYHHLIAAFDATTTQPLPAYPRVTDDYQFLSSSTIAKVTNGVPNQVLAGTGLGLLHAYDGVTGLDAPDFPKVTGGWLFAPAAIDDAGHTAAITREGYLFQWDTEQPECQPDGVWARYRHDDHGSGNTATDGVAPGTPTDARLTQVDGGTFDLDFTAPGDDGLCGTPASYAARAGDTDVAVDGPGAAVELPGDAGTLVLSAVDEAGNRGIPVRVPYERSTPDEPSPGPSPAPSAGPTPAPAGTGTPGPGPGGEGCTDTAAPESLITVARVRKRFVRIVGTARDEGCAGLRRVSASVARRVGRGRCRFLRRSGRFGPKRRCAKHRFTPAAGLARWRLRIRGRMPVGEYVATARARDQQDNLEGPAERVRFRRRA